MKYGTNLVAIISKLFLTLATRSLLLLGLWTWPSHAKQWEYFFFRSISRAHRSSLYCYTFRNSPEFFILLYFCKSYLLKLSFVLRLFSSHYPKHATIVVHENCWDSLKAPPDFFTFMWYSCRTWVITKTFPAMQDMNGTSAKTFSDIV